MEEKRMKEKRMKEKVMEVLRDINEDILTYDGTNMMADGIIDSFETIEIISSLEAAFGIEIDAENVIAENFENKDTIVQMMKRIYLARSKC